MATDESTAKAATATTSASWLESSPTLFVQSEGQSCEKFLANFFRNVRHFVLRGTGGCGNMKPEYYFGLENLKLALGGDLDVPESAPLDDTRRAKFEGFCLFGGTRMIGKADPSQIYLGITEVFPALSARCPDARILGVVAKAGHLRTTPHGTIVSHSDADPYVTIIHPVQHSVLLLQPTVDKLANWDSEYQRCIDICEAPAKNNWPGLLIAYNGGGVTAREISAWAQLGRKDPFYRVLLVKDSGGTAGEFACDQNFLDEHPHVHVCENTVESMRAKLLELGAIVTPQASVSNSAD
jgi:hypothetical protein